MGSVWDDLREAIKKEHVGRSESPIVKKQIEPVKQEIRNYESDDSAEGYEDEGSDEIPMSVKEWLERGLCLESAEIMAELRKPKICLDFATGPTQVTLSDEWSKLNYWNKRS